MLKLLTILFVVACALPAVSQSLALSVRTDRETYRLSDEIKLESMIRNTGKDDIYLSTWDLCWNPARGLTMSITASDGSEVHSRVLLDCVSPPPRPGDVYQFVKLEPRTFYGTINTFKIKDLIPKPGEFTIQITFRSFLSEGWVKEYLASDPIAGVKLWTMEMPVVTASPVHIVVSR